jgi:L-asparaginase
MVETATALAHAALPATIVLTGAMVPASIERSDAAFNLGFAVASAQTLPAGVWIAMNGRAHAWNRVRKNRELGCFEPIV